MASRTTTGTSTVLKAIRWLSINAIDRSSLTDTKTIGKLMKEKWNHGQLMILIYLIGFISIFDIKAVLGIHSEGCIIGIHFYN